MTLHLDDLRRRLPHVMLVGAAGRNAGKTEYCCAVLRRLAGQFPIVAAKVTTVRERDGRCPRGGAGCGVCSSLQGNFCLTRETGEPAQKDTSRLLAAGARRVYWLRVDHQHLAEGLAALLASLEPGELLLCESNSLARLMDPGLFFIIRAQHNEAMKPSAAEVAHLADEVVVSDGSSFTLAPERVSVVNGAWTWQRPAQAIVLAGGLSSRMGQDKSLLPVGGRTMIEHIIEQLRPQFQHMAISANDSGPFAHLGLPVIPDQMEGQGPLMALVSALDASSCEINFLVSCDVPEIPVPLVTLLMRSLGDAPGVIPVTADGRKQPLFALYRRSVRDGARQALAQGRRGMLAAADACGCKLLHLPADLTIHNLNTMDDYRSWLSLQGQGG